MKLWRSRFSNIYRDCEGAIAVEMALVAVSVFAAVPVMIDVVSLINSGMTLSGSLRSGAQIALVQPNNNTAIREAIEVSSGFPSGSVSVTTDQFCECDSIATSCSTATCPAEHFAPSMFMTLTAEYTVNTMLTYPPSMSSLTRTTTFRVR
jgi:Flp pilus assembly protein TadG